MSGNRLLVVEDEKIIALDLQRRLEKFGYHVVALASDADAAVSQAHQHRPDIVLMDIMLGGERDGVDAAVAIREELEIPVVFLTAYADDRTVERAKRAEPVGYVLKPFKERELQTTIEIALYKARIDQHLKAQEKLFETLLDTIHDGLIAFDSETLIRFMNPVAQSLTGVHESTVIGRQLSEIFELYDETSEVPVAIPLTSVAEGRDFDFENVYLRTELGAHVSVAGSITPITTEDGVDGGLITFRDVTHIKHMSRVIEYQASHDSLTGLMNREEFFSRLQDVARDAQSNRKAHSFLYIDLDQFKVVNDVCGHLAGDELLRQVSDDIRSLVESEEHMIARLGGDEFGILLLNCPLSRGMGLARSVQHSLSRRFIWQKHAFNIAASIGVVPVAGVNADGYAILAAADDAAYLAKEAGGNTIKVYETADYTFLKRRGEMQWISRLNHALEEGSFVLWGQPIVSTNGVTEQRMEVLIRMQDVDGSLISPADFIPAAEKYNLMPAVDRWVVSSTFAYMDRHARNGGSTQVSINLSGASVADESFLPFIHSLLERYALDARSICFEITETTAIANMSRATSFMNRLKSLGCSFALDDFGNGFSSFSYLKKLPVDYLKIDGSFVRGIATDPIDRALVESVNSIGHVMGMKTIAEYVTDAATLNLLTEIGVDYVQGYEIARPAPLS